MTAEESNAEQRHKQQCESYERKLTELNKEIERLNQTIAQLKNKVNALDLIIVIKDNQLQGKDKEIPALTKDRGTLQTKYEEERKQREYVNFSFEETNGKSMALEEEKKSLKRTSLLKPTGIKNEN